MYAYACITFASFVTGGIKSRDMSTFKTEIIVAHTSIIVLSNCKYYTFWIKSTTSYNDGMEK